MKRILIVIVSVIVSVADYAQTALDEDFEDFDFTGWTTVYPAGYNTTAGTYTFGWQTGLYASDAQLTKAVNVGSNAKGEKVALKSMTGRYNTTTNVKNDNWLISPAVTIDKDHCYLTFQFGANDQINISSTVKSDENRMKLQVLVSTEGTDTATFKDVKMQVIPMGVQKWCAYCVDLSQYIGKEIHVAFRDYGTAINAFKDYKYLDNMHLGAVSVPDYAIVGSVSVYGGAQYEQPYSIKVVNYGADKGGFTASYRLGDKTVSETVSTEIASGDTLEYTFKENLKFTPGESAAFSAWVYNADDAFTANDTTAETTVTTATQHDLPYTSTAESLQGEFTGVTTSSTYGSMVYDASKAQGWLFTQKSSSKFGYAYLYTNKAFNLPKGDVRLSITGTVIGEDIKYEVYIAKYGATKMADYATLVGTSETLPASATDATSEINIVIPEAGYYIIGIRPMAYTANDQTAIHGFSLEDMSGGDVALTALGSPMKAVLIGSHNISVDVKNNSSSEAKNVTVAFSVNGSEPIKETIESIGGGETKTHTFTTQAVLKSVGTYLIKAWVEKGEDTDRSNDSASVYTYAYEVKSFPYTTTFETQTDSLEWQDVNVGSSNSYWAAAANVYAIDGNRVMYIDRNVAAKHDNFAVSPAIRLEAGQKGRISFYYIGTASSNGLLQVYLVKSIDKESLLDAKYIGYASVLPTYGYFSAPVSVTETGNYYIAVRQSESGYDMWFDDLRFDANAEILVTAAETDVKGTTDTATETALKVQVRNAGVKDLSGVTVSYTIKGGSTVTETIPVTISANTDYVYTFQKKIFLDKPGQDTITVTVSHPEDTDPKNDAVTILGPTKVMYLKVPFTFGFEDSDLNALCTEGNNWIIGTKSPSDGKQSLLHQGAAYTNGDWFYLPAMSLTKGSYNLSFFWKTYTSQTHTSPQSFGVYVGTAAKPSSMTITVKELSNVTNADYKATKEMSTIEIPEDGIYYIGIRCTSVADAELTSQTLNQLILDQFEFHALPVEGMTIAEGTTINTDLLNTEEWHRYYTNSTAAKQWTASGYSIYTTRQYNTSTGIWLTPGLLRYQPIAVKAGETYSINMNYSIDKVGATTLDGNSTLSIYAANLDMPEDYTASVLCGKENATEVNGTFTATEDGIVYFGVICDSKVSAKFTLSAITITHVNATAITEVLGTLPTGEGWGEAYNLAGQRVGADAKGIIIVHGKKQFNH